jgi:hypothetical protein
MKKGIPLSRKTYQIKKSAPYRVCAFFLFKVRKVGLLPPNPKALAPDFEPFRRGFFCFEKCGK